MVSAVQGEAISFCTGPEVCIDSSVAQALKKEDVCNCTDPDVCVCSSMAQAAEDEDMCTCTDPDVCTCSSIASSALAHLPCIDPDVCTCADPDICICSAVVSLPAAEDEDDICTCTDPDVCTCSPPLFSFEDETLCTCTDPDVCICSECTTDIASSVASITSSEEFIAVDFSSHEFSEVNPGEDSEEWVNGGVSTSPDESLTVMKCIDEVANPPNLQVDQKSIHRPQSFKETTCAQSLKEKLLAQLTCWEFVKKSWWSI